MSKSPDFEKPISVDVGDIYVSSLYFSWQQDTVGFGECSVKRNEDGTFTADTENMSKEWLRRALYSLMDTIVENAKLV